MAKVNTSIQIKEKYHLFRRGDEICRYGIFGLTREYFQKNKPPPAPDENVKIKLEIPQPEIRVMQAVITARCNLKCTYCSFAANAPKLAQMDMTREEITSLSQRFNRDIGEDGLLLITGGEPELHPEAVDYLAEHVSGKIIIFTNGTLINRERLDNFRRKDVGVLFSLDGDLFAQDTVRRGKDGSYNKVAEALKMAREVGLDYGISAVVGDHNIARLPELVEYIYEEFRPASLGLNLPHCYDGTLWNRIEEYTAALLQIFSFAKRKRLFIDQINRRLAPLVSQKFRFRDCSAQGEKIVVYPGGITTSCVNETALQDRKLDWGKRIPILSEKCQDCYAIGICGGGCIFDAEAVFGEGRFDERNCYFTSRLLEHMIWDFREELGDGAGNPDLLRQAYGDLLKRGKGTRFSVGHETA
jgi:uncharacterized protein